MAERKEGSISWNKAPYGYMLDSLNKGQIIPDEDAAKTVKAIFDKAASGMHFTAIAQELNQSGIPSPGRYRQLHDNSGRSSAAEIVNENWRSATVRRVALNPVYIGRAFAVSRGLTAVDDPQRFPITHEPIVSDEVFGTVVELYRKRMALPVSQKDFLFDGLVFCSNCGSALSLKEGTEHVLVCQKEKSRGRGKCKAPGCIGYLELQKLVVDELNKTLAQQKMAKRESEDDLEIDDHERLNKIRNRIDLIDRIVMRVYEDMESGLLLTRSGQSMILKFQNEVSSLLEEEGKYRTILEAHEEIPETKALEDLAPDKLYSIEDLTQELLKTHISMIQVGPKAHTESPLDNVGEKNGSHSHVRIVIKKNS